VSWWALDGDALEAERLVGQDLHPLALGELPVEVHDLGDLVVGEALTLVANALGHLLPQLPGVDELHEALAPADAGDSNPDSNGRVRTAPLRTERDRWAW
jgi:hypothetical protein